MKLLNYLNLYSHPVHLSFCKDRTEEFVDIYHAHQGMELLYVHEGRGQIIVNQRIVHLAPGSLFFFRPFQLHRMQLRLEPGERYIRSLFVFEPSGLDGYLAPFGSLRAFFRRLWKEPAEGTQQFAGLPEEAIRGLFDLYCNHMLSGDGEKRLELEEQMLFLAALLQLLKSFEAPGQRGEAESPAVRSFSIAERIMKWVEEHYMEEFDLKRLAADIHLTPTHVSAAFRHKAGTSITEYLTARRIRQACLLLQTTELPIHEVSLAIGLTNVSYFCNLFKKHVGFSPLRYRNSGGSGI